MAINIGLVVHDKINLQNAVDFAAYYAAQRQAEMLNVIAHQNYQIRQAYKLMVFRYRVMGQAGLNSAPWKSQIFPSEIPVNIDTEAPIVCVSRREMFREVTDDTICHQKNINIRPIQIPIAIAAFDPLNLAFLLDTQKGNEQITAMCKDYGGMNFMYTANAMLSFRLEQVQRKKLILMLAQNLALPFDRMVDLDGNTVATGINRTFNNNLTYENFNNRVSIEYFNSMEGVNPRDWLNELPIKFQMYYADVISREGCRSSPKSVYQGPVSKWILSDQQIAEYLQGIAPPPPGSIDQYSLGFEKNPWYLVYAGVRARTRPRQVFWPFGDRIEFEASAFAQPFGGRIGPWYYSNWPTKSRSSVPGVKVDLVGPPLASENLPPEDPRLIPNYSRYPGDQLGLNSAAAHAAYGLLNQIGSIKEYFDTIKFGPNAPNDALPFDSFQNTGGPLRGIETAAVAPDLFDITYYSIDPNFMGEGQTSVGSSNGARLRLSLNRMKQTVGAGFDDVTVLGDHGSRQGAGSTLEQFSVSRQIVLANGDGGPSIFRPEAAWFVRDRAHLLVDWVHNDSFEVQPDPFNAVNLTRFGRCPEFDDGRPVRAPGSCLGGPTGGGRSGYSVKIVSKRFLEGAMRLGSQQDGASIIENGPPADW